MWGGWLYWDDFILQGQAARLGFSTDLLLNNHDGHVMPLTYSVVWLIQHISGLNYGLVAATMLIGQIALVASATIAMRVMLGRGTASVVGLGVLLLSPIMLPGFTWWSAALTLVPLMCCLLLATATQVTYLRTGRVWALITTYALGIVALGFFEKSLLLPFWLVGVSVLVNREPGFWLSLRSTLVSHWRIWVGWAVIIVVYLIGFAQVAQGRTNLPTGPGQVLELLRRAVFVTIAPGLLGGPLHWTPVDYSASFADPPWWLIVAGAIALVTLVVAGLMQPGFTRKAWLVAGGYLTLDLATFAVGRLGPNGDPGVIQAGRYVATAMIGISIATAVTLASRSHLLTDARRKWAAVAGLTAIGLFTMLSSLAYAAIWSNNPAQTWVGNARSDLAATNQAVPLLDQDVPDFLLLPVTHPYNQASWFLAPLSPQPGFATSTSELQVLDNRGFLIPADVEGAPSQPPTGPCYSAGPGTPVTIPLAHEVIPWLHTVAMDYSAPSSGRVQVSIGSGEPITATVETGSHQLFVRAEGGESSVTVTPVDTTVCIPSLEVGRVVPRDLPYGGSTDLSDQLREMQNGTSG
jgi:hypothetical protein